MVWNSDQLTFEELQAAGMARYIVDRASHPGFYA